MREIRFRAFDKKNKIIVNVGSIEFTDRIEGRTGCNVFVDGKTTKDSYWLDDGDFELIQFSGMRDKDGINVYEGNICIIDYLGGEKSKGVIEFKHGAFVFQSKEDPSKQVAGWQMIHQCKNLEVIGNIYETPEFLK